MVGSAEDEPRAQPERSAPAPASGPPAASARVHEPRLAVVVPATDVPPTLSRCLFAIRDAMAPTDELLVITEPAMAGPAAARNAGAEQATAEVLVFVDADVVVHPDALTRLRTAFAADPGLTAVFGSYDDGPSSPGVVSEFRNLLHHYVHHRHPGVAATFWSGLGAVRRREFLALGGFDTERFPLPAVEDIDLGTRLAAAGGRIELHPRVQGTHLKHWTVANMVQTDFRRRGVPWAVICLERRTIPRTLNLSWRERASTAATVTIAAGALSRRPRRAALGAAAVLLLNGPFYAMLARQMGVWRGAAGIGLHVLHRFVGIAALPFGVVVYLRRRKAG